jgi:SAM-dependent methyltransferase
VISAAKANRRYFREAYRTGQHGWAIEEPSPYVVRFLRRVKRVIPGGTLLDVGCGEGRHAIAAAGFGFKVTGADYEPLALARARRFSKAKHAEGIVYRRADVLQLPFPDASFDVVLDYGCLHHQRKTDWRAYKDGILRVMKPRGFYVLSVFAPEFFLFRGSRRPWHIAQGAYRRCFTRRQIEALFEKNFEILELIREKDGPRDFWDALMRRRSASQAPP